MGSIKTNTPFAILRIFLIKLIFEEITFTVVFTELELN